MAISPLKASLTKKIKMDTVTVTGAVGRRQGTVTILDGMIGKTSLRNWLLIKDPNDEWEKMRIPVWENSKGPEVEMSSTGSGYNKQICVASENRGEDDEERG